MSTDGVLIYYLHIFFASVVEDVELEMSTDSESENESKPQIDGEVGTVGKTSQIFYCISKCGCVCNLGLTCQFPIVRHYTLQVL